MKSLIPSNLLRRQPVSPCPGDNRWSISRLMLSKDYMLPGIEIEARSIDGNIKACEFICQTLMEKPYIYAH